MSILRFATTSFALAGILLLGACARSATPAPSGSAGRPNEAKKQIVAGIFSSPAGMHQELTNPQGTSGSVPGLGELYAMMDGALSYVDEGFERHPWLADSVPTVDNGLWKVFPDGSMETTWRIKPDVAWHDGAPVTSDDLQFTIDVYRDRDVGVVPIRGLSLVDAIELPDARTAVLHWRQPFISADTFFSAGPTMWILPRHLLERPFQDAKDNFLGLPYWQGEFVGAGPFKMQNWAPGSSVTLVANDEYVLGRPKLAQIEVRFFTDRGALIASLLAGAIQIPIGRGLYPQDVLQIRDSAQNVKVQLSGPLGLPLPVYPQSINPDPPIVGNVQFRRALLMAIDRQEMTDTLNYGLGPVANSWVPPDEPEGRAVDGRLVRYEHDTRAATQMIEALGYAKDADGFFQSTDGARLTVQLATHMQNSVHEPATLSVARYWKEFGVDVQLDVRSAEQAFDLRWRALYPAFFLVSRGLPVDRPDGYFTRKAIPTQESNFSGGNVARYGTPELDSLIQRYITTIPFNDRMAALGDIVHLQTDQVTMMPLFFQGAAFVLGANQLQNVTGGLVWNAHEWDLDMGS